MAENGSKRPARRSRTPVAPDDAAQREQVRHFLDLLIPAGVAYSLAAGVAGIAFGSWRALAAAVVLALYLAWVAAFPRRALATTAVPVIIGPVAVGLMAVVVTVAILQPYVSFAAATALLIPIAASLPYLQVRSLRRLMLLAWAATAATAAAGLLPDDGAMPQTARLIIRLWGLTLASGIVLFLLYQSSQRLKESGRDFVRLFRLSSDLAETTEPSVLGELVARHLAEATGFEECVIYALDAETGRLAPFGSYPADRSLEADPESLAERPALGRVVHDGARLIVDLADVEADHTERARLRTLGRQSMLLLPLMAQADPVGVAELLARDERKVDPHRLALARTLAFEAALAIENGRLYHQLRQRALHDPLTGLANRSLFHDRVEHALARLRRRPGDLLALLFVDLDDFKGVNDTLGHARGDRLLVMVAERFRGVVRPADTVARLGGDEFAILLEDVASADEALAVANRLLDGLNTPFDLAGQPATASASIGVTLRSANGTDVDELIQEADLAMYAAKRAGKRRCTMFHDGLRQHDRPAAKPGRGESLARAGRPTVAPRS